MRRRINSAIVSLAGIMLAIYLAGCSGLAPGYRALLVVKEAGDQTGKTMAAVCKAKRLECEKKHAADKPALKACVKPCRDALERWVKYARPAINSAQLATWAALETAYQAEKHEADWLKLLKPGACALIKLLEQWKAIAPAKFAAVIATISGLKGLVCS
jgi:hypothetical protein